MEKGDHYLIPNAHPLEIGLSWDFIGDEIDLDATVVLINDVGSIADAVYYNQLVSKCGAITHSGDCKDGKKDGFNELVKIDLHKVDFEVSYLAVLVSSYQGVGFKNIETATVSTMQDGAKINEVYLGAVRSEVNNTVLASIIYKKSG
jgi:tellurium resistance protein TerZ